MKASDNLRVCIVHDWIATYTGAEKVVEQLLTMYPEADLFTVVDVLDEKKRTFLKGRAVKTSFIQNLPFVRKKYRSYLPLMPLAVEGFDLSEYDLIISSSSAVAKGVITGPEQVHICYCHSPVRYAWDLQHQYLRQAGLTKGLKRMYARALLHYIRLWDVRTANGVDHFVANSAYISRRIYKTYHRQADVVYPPVDIHSFTPGPSTREDFYLVVSRFVPYKRVPLIVEAFKHMPDLRLCVVGDGPDFEKCRQAASPNVTLLGYQSDKRVVDLLQKAKAFVFAAEEDFGIVVVEAQACGTPVICYGKGGTTETVIPDETGMVFQEQTPQSIIEAVRRFESRKDGFSPAVIRENAERFSPEIFRDEFSRIVARSLEDSSLHRKAQSNSSSVLSWKGNSARQRM